jgi:hypothetical protein
MSHRRSSHHPRIPFIMYKSLQSLRGVFFGLICLCKFWSSFFFPFLLVIRWLRSALALKKCLFQSDLFVEVSKNVHKYNGVLKGINLFFGRLTDWEWGALFLFQSHLLWSPCFSFSISLIEIRTDWRLPCSFGSAQVSLMFFTRVYISMGLWFILFAEHLSCQILCSFDMIILMQGH